MEALNKRNPQTPSEYITYVEYAKQLYLHDMDVLSNSIIEEFAAKFCAMKRPVAPAMIHAVLMEVNAELYPTKNGYAFLRYGYGEIPFPVETELSIYDKGFCAVFRAILGMTRNSPAVKGKEKPKKKQSQPRSTKSRRAYKEKDLACALLATTSLNCVADAAYKISDPMFQNTMLSLLRQDLACN